MIFNAILECVTRFVYIIYTTFISNYVFDVLLLVVLQFFSYFQNRNLICYTNIITNVFMPTKPRNLQLTIEHLKKKKLFDN